MTSWLLRHASYGEVLEFYRRFAGYNIPKNPVVASSQFRNDILQAMLPLVARYGLRIPESEIAQIAEDFACSLSTTKQIWQMFRRKAIENGARWAIRRP